MWCHKPYTKGQILSLRREGQLSFRKQMKLDANMCGQKTVNACGNGLSTGSFPALKKGRAETEKLHPHFCMQLCKRRVEIQESVVSSCSQSRVFYWAHCLPDMDGAQCKPAWAHKTHSENSVWQTRASGTSMKKQLALWWQSLANQTGVLPLLCHSSS